MAALEQSVLAERVATLEEQIADLANLLGGLAESITGMAAEDYVGEDWDGELLWEIQPDPNAKPDDPPSGIWIVKRSRRQSDER